MGRRVAELPSLRGGGSSSCWDGDPGVARAGISFLLCQFLGLVGALGAAVGADWHRFICWACL